jgi:DNA-binding FadR family transcriptional regulator
MSANRPTTLGARIRDIVSMRRKLSPLASELGERIVNGDFPPSTSLSERMFGPARAISRTSFREAIKVLEGKGLVTLRQGTGTRVAPQDQWHTLDPDMVAWRLTRGSSLDAYFADFFAVRRLIEPSAAEAAATLRDPAKVSKIRRALEEMKRLEEQDPYGSGFVSADVEFHKSILVASGNEILVALGQILEVPMELLFSITSEIGSEYRIDVHEAVLAEIEAGNPKGAFAASERMLAHIGEDVRQAIKITTRTEVVG